MISLILSGLGNVRGWSWAAIVIVFIAIPHAPVFAGVFPGEDFESYSAGSLDGANGGSGWAGAWGAGSLPCEADLVVSTSSVMIGTSSLQVNVDLDADDTCMRELAAPITGTEGYSFKVRSSRTDNRLLMFLQDNSVVNDHYGIQMFLGSNGYIQVTDDLSTVNLQTYSGDTTYTIEVYPDVANETFTVSINGGTTSAPYHFVDYQNRTYTSLGYFRVQDGADVSSGTMYVDAIAPLPHEDFESYSAGSLDGANGGSGWAGAWGAGSLPCEADLVVSTSSVMIGTSSLQVNVDLDADDTCMRELAAPITGTEGYSFKVRSSRTDNRLLVFLQDNGVVGDHYGIQVFLGSNGYIRVTDDLSAVNLQTYSADTTYGIRLYPNVPNETYTISVNGGAAYGPYHFVDYQNRTYTSLGYFRVQDGADVSSGTMYVDEIAFY